MSSNTKYQKRTKQYRKRCEKRSLRKNRTSKSFLLEMPVEMKGGMFTGNFETYLDRLSSDAYIPFNTATGTVADPIAPISQVASRLDMQIPTTPNLMKGGRKTPQSMKGSKQSQKKKGKRSKTMKGGYWLGSAPVFRETSSNNAYALGTLATDRQIISAAAVTNQPVSTPANLYANQFVI